MAVRTKGPTIQAGKKERAMTDEPTSDEGAPLSVEEAARLAQDAYDKLALNKLELLDKMSERARTAYRAGTNVNVDRAADAGNTKAMNDITREEFNARMETIEVKMDARVESVSTKIDGFLAAQAERDKAQAERDKRFEMLAERATKAAEGAEEAAKQAATVKNNYWAAVGVQLLAVAAILVGAYFANQGNALMVAQTTLAAFASGKDAAPGNENSKAPLPSTPQPSK